MKVLEVDDYFFNLIIILFLLITFDQTIGIIYLGMALIDAFFYYWAIDSKFFTPIPTETGNRYMNIVIGGVLYIVFVYISFFIVSFFQTQSFSTSTLAFREISQMVAQTFSATPILHSSVFLRLAVWGIVIPIVETRFFFRTCVQYFARFAFFTELPNILSLKGQGLSIFTGSVFTIFHIIAKGITNEPALLITFIFGYISVLCVLYFKEISQAYWLHIITNTYATMVFLGISIYANPFLLVGIILLAWFMVFQELPLIPSRRSSS
jgi:hypothetical protein